MISLICNEKNIHHIHESHETLIYDRKEEKFKLSKRLEFSCSCNKTFKNSTEFEAHMNTKINGIYIHKPYVTKLNIS